MIRMGDTEDGSYDLSSVPCAWLRVIGMLLLSAGQTQTEAYTLRTAFALDVKGR